MNVWEYAFPDDCYEEIGALDFFEHCRFFDQWQDGVRGETPPKMKICTNPESEVPARKGDFPPPLLSARSSSAQGRLKPMRICCRVR